MAYVDSGADTCIAGAGWIPLSYTGRKANLVGYDDCSTKKTGLDICTIATKFVTAAGCPDLILVANETVYNPDSSVSLVSEYQVRDYGCVVDSISKNHRASISGYKGTQSFYPRDDFPIPLKLMKGLMGCHICEPSKEDLTQLEQIIITVDSPWRPWLYSDDNEDTFVSQSEQTASIGGSHAKILFSKF